MLEIIMNLIISTAGSIIAYVMIEAVKNKKNNRSIKNRKNNKQIASGENFFHINPSLVSSSKNPNKMSTTNIMTIITRLIAAPALKL